MLLNPTTDKLRTLRLFGMAKALQEQSQHTLYEPMTFEERLGLLVDRETTHRANHKLSIRLGKAKLRQDAAFEDIDYSVVRGLDRSLMAALGDGGWIKKRQNCLITGPTGVGKSFIACALAHKVCRDGSTVRYARVPRLFSELTMAKADGSYGRKLMALAKTDLLLLDDWGLAPMTSEHSRDFLEILDDRYDRRSTLVVSQLPVDQWHETMPDPTVADAALDRLVHNSHRIILSGESARKRRAALTEMHDQTT